MGYCSIDDLFADVYVNGGLLVRFEDPPIDYSIDPISGQPYSINADGVSKHLIQNPTSYSWEIVPDKVNWSVTYQYSVYDSRYGWGAWSSTLSSPTFTTDGYYDHLELENNITNSFSLSLEYVCYDYQNANIYLWAFTSESGEKVKVTEYSISNAYPVIYFGRRYRLIGVSSTNGYKLKVTDGGINYYYSITDTDSVEVIYGEGGYKLTIESQAHTIEQIYNNSPTVEVICGENCPPNTCKIECDDHYCCYNSSGIAIKVIPK